MKKIIYGKMIFSFFLLINMSLCSCKNAKYNISIDEDTYEIENVNESDSLMQTESAKIQIDNSEDIKDVKVIEDISEDIVGNETYTDFETYIEDDSFDSYVRESICLSDDEEIESFGWIEDQVCFKVSIRRTYNIEGEYSHLSDYVFVNEGDKYTYVNITYPLKGDSFDSDRYVWLYNEFIVKYEDVTFDGKKDIVVSLGYQGTQCIAINCAYINVDGQFIYEKSFESIPNYSVNDNEKCIEGFYEDYMCKYIYEDGQFIEIEKEKRTMGE